MGRRRRIRRENKEALVKSFKKQHKKKEKRRTLKINSRNDFMVLKDSQKNKRNQAKTI
jgi:hypothetical protein